MICMSDLNLCIVLSRLTDWITFSSRENDDLCSPYQNIRRLNL